MTEPLFFLQSFDRAIKESVAADGRDTERDADQWTLSVLLNYFTSSGRMGLHSVEELVRTADVYM